MYKIIIEDTVEVTVNNLRIDGNGKAHTVLATLFNYTFLPTIIT
jgi:hypothetical protein